MTLHRKESEPSMSDAEIISFTKVSLPNGWLSNMSPHAVFHMGRTWRTCEALFQSLRFDDKSIIEEIFAEKSPMAAKMVAKSNARSMRVAPQSPEDIGNMSQVLRCKIVNHQDLRRMLYDTGTATIVENVSKRPHGSGMFWGAKLLADGSWEGENMLGKLWMELREDGTPPGLATDAGRRSASCNELHPKA